MGLLRPRMVVPSPLSNHGIPCRCDSRLRRLPRGKDVLFRALGISVCGQHYLFLKKKKQKTKKPNIYLVALGLSCSTWDPCCPTRVQTCVPCIGRRILNHWTIGEVLGNITLINTSSASNFFHFMCCFLTPHI